MLNLPAVVLIVLCALLLIRGASESAKVNAVMVMIKIGVLLLFIVIGIQGWNSDNLSDFAPFGLHGITSAAGIIFFSYIGLDAVSTAGEEVKNPRRNMPLAILISLVVVTGLYILVTIVAVAAQPYSEFEGQEAGLAAILEDVTGSTWPATVLAAGAIISIFSVTLVVLYGQTRILFAMARDGMLPEIFHRVNPRTLTPVPNTIIVAVVISLLAGLIPINFLAEMTSIGTLVAFLVVSVGVMVLRSTHPELPRGFKVPGYPVTPVLSILGCLWIIKDLRAVTIWVFLIWVAVAFVWYAYYGFKHSHLGRHEHVGLIHDEVGAPSDDHDRGLRARRAREGRPAPRLPAGPVRRRGPGGRPRWSRRRGSPAWPRSTRSTASTSTRRPPRRSTAARENLPDDVSATFVPHSARSAAVGLLELAEEHGANVIVLGSSSHGSFGHVALGSVTDRLVHSSPVTLCVRPARLPVAGRVSRSRAPRRRTAGRRAPTTSSSRRQPWLPRNGASLRIASFAVWARPAYTTRLGTDSEDDVLSEWTSTMAAGSEQGRGPGRGARSRRHRSRR